ncbi:hypothetical protein [Bacteroides reticulotermitis]|uniref:hypothetical protein n=1 Tax=Bacteroides reticulotermitis TaxID=1133319 RepID=UPI003A8C0360
MSGIKSVLLMIVVVVLTSCGKVMYTESVYMVDYREYINAGFTISPTVTGFNYQPISNLEVVFSSGQLPKGASDKDLQKIDQYNGYKGSVIKYSPTGKRMMDKIVSEAKAMGANGLINFQTSYSPRNSTWTVSGLAVKVIK